MSRNRPDRRPRYPRRVFALKLVVAFGLLAVVVVLNRGPIREVLSRPIDVGRFGLAFACYTGGLVLAFVRWTLYVQAVGVPFRLQDGLRVGFIAQMFNYILPGGPVGGDVVRAAFLCREHRSRRPAVIASVVLDRFVGLLALFLVAGGVGTWAWPGLDPVIRRLVVLAWAISGLVTLILALAFSPVLYRPLARRAAGRPKLARRLEELAEMGAAYRGRLGMVAAGLASGVLTHILNVLAFYLVSRALFPIVPTLAEHALIVPLVLLTLAIPLPFGALGVGEAASAELFTLANYDGGAVAMMGFRVVQYATTLISAAIYAANPSQVRELQAEAEHLAEEGLEIAPSGTGEAIS